MSSTSVRSCSAPSSLDSHHPALESLPSRQPTKMDVPAAAAAQAAVFPQEIMDHIYSFCDRPTLAVVCQASLASLISASGKLYEHVTIRGAKQMQRAQRLKVSFYHHNYAAYVEDRTLTELASRRRRELSGCHPFSPFPVPRP